MVSALKCRYGLFNRRLELLAGWPRVVKFATLQMVDVHQGTIDGRHLVLPRHTEPGRARTSSFSTN